ncbi:uncharacterized protein TNCV_1161241 [Trichonephila clavipes]|nr:uncharacterized protein TNCV_1161241 [Trichonephila clavipes]
MRIIFQQSQDLACLSVCATWLNFKDVTITITVLRSSNDIGPRTWCNRRRMWNASLLLGCTVYTLPKTLSAAVAEWYRYRTVACIVTSSSPVPLKTRRVGQRCTLNLSRAETSSRWCGVVVRRGGASSGVVHVT